MFKCLNCGKGVKTAEVKDRNRCPFCGYRVLVKKRAEIKKRVDAV